MFCVPLRATEMANDDHAQLVDTPVARGFLHRTTDHMTCGRQSLCGLNAAAPLLKRRHMRGMTLMNRCKLCSARQVWPSRAGYSQH
jgi:hypothetical protein